MSNIHVKRCSGVGGERFFPLLGFNPPSANKMTRRANLPGILSRSSGNGTKIQALSIEPGQVERSIDILVEGIQERLPEMVSVWMNGNLSTEGSLGYYMTTIPGRIRGAIYSTYEDHLSRVSGALKEEI